MEDEIRTTTYYMIVCKDKIAYGGYETFEEAMDFFQRDGKAMWIEKIVETRSIVYEK